MSDYVTLLGAEQIQRAASQMSSAADTIQRAANQIDAAFDRLINALNEHGLKLEELLIREESK